MKSDYTFSEVIKPRQMSSSNLFTYICTVERPMHLGLPAFELLQSQWQLFVIIFLAYFLLVRFLRYERARSLERKFAPAGRASFSTITTNNAQEILKDLTELEFPKFFGFSIIFALFKVGAEEMPICYMRANGRFRLMVFPVCLLCS